MAISDASAQTPSPTSRQTLARHRVAELLARAETFVEGAPMRRRDRWIFLFRQGSLQQRRMFPGLAVTASGSENASKESSGSIESGHAGFEPGSPDRFKFLLGNFLGEELWIGGDFIERG